MKSTKPGGDYIFSRFAAKIAPILDSHESKYEPGCWYCTRRASPTERYPTCARCKTIVYCSRECQKKDWPNHKVMCNDAERQRSYVIKSLIRINDDAFIMSSLRLALAARYYHELTSTNPDPRKMWIAGVTMIIYPHDTKDAKDLANPEIPLSSLLAKQITGSIRFAEITERSNCLPDDKFEAAWKAHRNDTDKLGHREAHVILTTFDYRNQVFFLIPFTIHPQDLALIREHKLYEIVEKENSGPLFELNSAIHREALEGDNAKKWTCPLGEDDKRYLRGRATKRGPGALI